MFQEACANFYSAEKECCSFQDILTYWLDLGVDGFYVRDSAYMFEDYDLRDETPVSNPGSTPTVRYC